MAATSSRTLPRPRGNPPEARTFASRRVSPRNIHELAQVFKLLADESRLRILMALAQGELHVTALCEVLQQTQPAVSHHLTLLRMAGLVGYRRDGKHNHYRLESNLVAELLEQVFQQTDQSPRFVHLEDFTLPPKRK